MLTRGVTTEVQTLGELRMRDTPKWVGWAIRMRLLVVSR